MSNYAYTGSSSTTRDLYFSSTNRNEIIANLHGWTGYDEDIEEIDVDGSIATITFCGGQTARFQLETASNVAERLD